MLNVNYRDKATRERAGLVNTSDICDLKDYNNVSILNRLITAKRAPPPDVIYGPDRLRFWKVERLDEFPEGDELKRRNSKYDAYDPAVQMSEKQLQLLRDTRRFLHILACG